MRKIDISVLKDNVIDLIGKQWMLITAGNIDHYNMMTASWGTIGFLWGKPVACVVIRPQNVLLSLSLMSSIGVPLNCAVRNRERK